MKKIKSQFVTTSVYPITKFAYVWVTGDAEVNSTEFDIVFAEMTDAWDEIQRYLKFHPDRSTKNTTADLVRKEMNFTHFSAIDFRRLYTLGWQHFNNEPQRMPCDPHKYRRIVGIRTDIPHNLTFTYGHHKVKGKWYIPEEYWNEDIIPTEYVALEQLMDEKGNITYLYHVLCMELDVEDTKGLAKCMYEIAKVDSRHNRRIHQPLKIYLPMTDQQL